VALNTITLTPIHHYAVNISTTCHWVAAVDILNTISKHYERNNAKVRNKDKHISNSNVVFVFFQRAVNVIVDLNKYNTIDENDKYYDDGM